MQIASPNAAFLTTTVLSLAGALAVAVLLPPAKTRMRPSVSPSSENGTYDAALCGNCWVFGNCAQSAVLPRYIFAVFGVLLATLALMVREQRRPRHLATILTALLLPTKVLTVLGLMILTASRSVSVVVSALLAIGAGTDGLGIPLLTMLGDLTPKHLFCRALLIYQQSGDLGGALGAIAGLEMGDALGYGAVGLVILLAVIPLAIHIRRKIP